MAQTISVVCATIYVLGNVCFWEVV